MPQTEVYVYSDGDDAPVLDWIDQLRRRDPNAVARIATAVDKLRQFGNELRRPHADYLRDGILELRVKVGRVNYRILYFYHGRNVALLAHGLTKEKEVPKVDIERAIQRRQIYLQNPPAHTRNLEI